MAIKESLFPDKLELTGSDIAELDADSQPKRLKEENRYIPYIADLRPVISGNSLDPRIRTKDGVVYVKTQIND